MTVFAVSGFTSSDVAVTQAIAHNSTLSSVDDRADSLRRSVDWADSVLATLSLREQAAQMVWPNLMGNYTADDDPQWQQLANVVTREHVGGVLISIGSPNEIAVKLNALQRLSNLPLLVSADLETGAGMRARGGYFVPNAIDLGGATYFPPNMAFGAANDTTLTYWAGRVTAVEGRALGIHLNFAPVMDVNNNPANPVINTRSYGENPQLVSRLGAMFIRGVQDGGMIATAKHFPGHGDTDVNSHLRLPVITATRERLDSVELVPFRAAIAANAGAVMTFHGSMPALDDSGVPGTLSHKVNTGLLRSELGFRGLIVSDAMDMRGVLDQYGEQESVKRAVASGVDILIQPVDVSTAIDAVVAGAAEHRYSVARLGESVRRILIAKHQLGLHRQRLVDVDSLRHVVGQLAHLVIARAVAEKSITVVKDSLAMIPVAATKRVLSVTVANRADLAAGAAFNATLRSGLTRPQTALHTSLHTSLRTAFVPADDPGASYAYLDILLDSVDVVVVSSYIGQRWDVSSVSAPAAFANWVTKVAARAQSGPSVAVVAFGNPYLLQQIPGVPSYVIGWGGAPESQRAAARVLLGEIPAQGNLPIRVQ